MALGTKKKIAMIPTGTKGKAYKSAMYAAASPQSLTTPPPTQKK